MKRAIRYYSRTHHTKKCCELIGEALGLEAKTIKEPLTEKVDELILGSSMYEFGIDVKVIRYLFENRNMIDKVYLVTTQCAHPVLVSWGELWLLGKLFGFKMARGSFHIRGEWHYKGHTGLLKFSKIVLAKGKPREKDYAKAAVWAKKTFTD